MDETKPSTIWNRFALFNFRTDIHDTIRANLVVNWRSILGFVLKKIFCARGGGDAHSQEYILKDEFTNYLENLDCFATISVFSLHENLHGPRCLPKMASAQNIDNCCTRSFLIIRTNGKHSFFLFFFNFKTNKRLRAILPCWRQILLASKTIYFSWTPRVRYRSNGCLQQLIHFWCTQW